VTEKALAVGRRKRGLEDFAARERAEEREVDRVRLVDPREDAVDDPASRRRAEQVIANTSCARAASSSSSRPERSTG
jgi:hypothetical protein